jgi:hypothetical protein
LAWHWKVADTPKEGGDMIEGTREWIFEPHDGTRQGLRVRLGKGARRALPARRRRLGNPEELTETQVLLLGRLGPGIVDGNGYILPRAQWHYRWTDPDTHQSGAVRLDRADRRTAKGISDEQIDAYIQCEMAGIRAAAGGVVSLSQG